MALQTRGFRKMGLWRDMWQSASRVLKVLGTLVFPTPQKPLFPNSNLILDSCELLRALWANKLHFILTFVYR